MEKIIIGRDKSDLKAFGDQGTVYIGKNIVGEGEDAHLTNPIYMDVTRPHVITIVGKRGSGKSYSMAVIAEEISRLPPEIKNNLSVLMVDTMGIFWSMKNPNEKDRDLLKEWGLKPQGCPIKFFAPKGYVSEYEDVGVKVDKPLTITTSDLGAEDWAITFGFSLVDPMGIAIERAIKGLRKTKALFTIQDIIDAIEKDMKTERNVKAGLANRFSAAEDWGLFEKKGTDISEFFERGGISVLDISHYTRSSEGWSVRGLVIGLLARKIFQERLMARKSEEFEVMGGEKKKSIPLVWIMSDEMHQFIPADGKNMASEPILTLIKEGREPGISIVMVTQMPNKLNSEALSQSDIVISHMLTSKDDLEALKVIMQTYVREDLEDYMKQLPKQKGAAIILDDNSERIFMSQIRPRFSWHAGGSPSAMKKKGLLESFME